MILIEFDEVEVSLLRGTPIRVGESVLVHPLKLSDIEEMGVKQYNQLLSVVLFNKNNLGADLPEHVTDLEVIMAICKEDVGFRMSFIESLKIFLQDEVTFDEESAFFYVQEKSVDSTTFEDIAGVIKMQNMLDGRQGSSTKKKSKKVRQMEEMMAQGRKLLSKDKKKDEMTLEKIISIVASNSPSLNHLSIWDFTVFQLYEYFNRMMKRDNFEQQFNLLLQGADIKSSDLKHWAT